MTLTSEKLLEQLKVAFDGVKRDGGISWSEARVLDDYGSEEEQEIARTSDTDQSWLELAVDPRWTIESYQSNFCFLDMIGFRYYIAAAIARHLILGTEVLDDFHLLNARRTGIDAFSLNQFKVLIGYMDFCVNERALQELDWKLNEANIDADDFFANESEFDIDLFDTSWQEARDQWNALLIEYENNFGQTDRDSSLISEI